MKQNSESPLLSRTEIICALILAGGQSSRMGEDKACLNIDEIPMLRRVYDVAAQCTLSVFVITPWPERYRSILPDTCQWILETTFLSESSRIDAPDSNPCSSSMPHSQKNPQGPLGAFQDGLSYLSTSKHCRPWVLLLGCDLPNLEYTILNRWIESLASVPPDAIAALIPYKTQENKTQENKTQEKPLESFEKLWEPLCGFYRISCLSNLQSFTKKGGQSFQRWLNTQSVHPLSVNRDITTMIMNCNTPSDMALARNMRQQYKSTH